MLYEIISGNFVSPSKTVILNRCAATHHERTPGVPQLTGTSLGGLRCAATYWCIWEDPRCAATYLCIVRGPQMCRNLLEYHERTSGVPQVTGALWEDSRCAAKVFSKIISRFYGIKKYFKMNYSKFCNLLMQFNLVP